MSVYTAWLVEKDGKYLLSVLPDTWTELASEAMHSKTENVACSIIRTMNIKNAKATKHIWGQTAVRSDELSQKLSEAKDSLDKNYDDPENVKELEKTIKLHRAVRSADEAQAWQSIRYLLRQYEYSQQLKEGNLTFNCKAVADQARAAIELLSAVRSDDKPRFTAHKNPNGNGRWIVYDNKNQEPYQTWDDEQIAKDHALELNEDIKPAVRPDDNPYDDAMGADEFFPALNNLKEVTRLINEFGSIVRGSKAHEWIQRGIVSLSAHRKKITELEKANEEMLRAMDFAISEGSEAETFLTAWQQGDTTEWPEFETDMVVRKK